MDCCKADAMKTRVPINNQNKNRAKLLKNSVREKRQKKCDYTANQMRGKYF